MKQPTLAYTAYTAGNQVVLVTRWQTIFDARIAIKGALKHFKAHGLPCFVWYNFVHEKSGEYEVWLRFPTCFDEREVARASETPPPYSNRGVTTLKVIEGAHEN
jgi:hypothetical protein